MATKLALKGGEKLDIVTRQEKLLELRELLEQGYASTQQIADHFGISRPTAMEWRNAALVLIAKDPNGFTREGIRNLQIGRIMAKIERIETEIKQADDAELRIKWHNLLNNYYERLHKITGLNTEVNIGLQAPNQLVIIKNHDQSHPEPPKQPMSQNAIEATTVNK